MSGHSKWATTKHQKAAADAKRSNLFTKIANLISVAARNGGDPEMNFTLRLAIEKAKAANMPKDKIEKAIKRGTGELGGGRIEEILYESYGPAGSAILIEALTDNKNRTSADIKAVLNKFGGKLAEAGAVAYLFDRKAEIKVESQVNEDIEMKIIESGGDDYSPLDNGYLIYAKVDQLKEIKDYLETQGLKITEASLVFEPKTTIELSDEESAKVIRILEALDDLDDVANVSSNLG